MKRLTDTTPEAQRVFDEIHRAMPAWRKWELLNDLYRFGRELHAAVVCKSKPDSTPAEIVADWIDRNLGSIPMGRTTERTVNQPIEMKQVVRLVVDSFNRLGIVYALGGSLASSIHGINRNTNDADFTVEPFPGNETTLAACFGADYYISEDSVRRAVQERSSFNIISTTTGYKVDVFVRKDRPFEVSLMDRRSPIVSPTAPGESIEVVSPEDIVLLKLEWFRLGDEVSERQWLDVLGVLRIQAGRLDEGYLDRWAAELGVPDLLAAARRETGI